MLINSMATDLLLEFNGLTEAFAIANIHRALRYFCDHTAMWAREETLTFGLEDVGQPISNSNRLVATLTPETDAIALRLLSTSFSRKKDLRIDSENSLIYYTGSVDCSLPDGDITVVYMQSIDRTATDLPYIFYQYIDGIKAMAKYFISVTPNRPYTDPSAAVAYRREGRDVIGSIKQDGGFNIKLST